MGSQPVYGPSPPWPGPSSAGPPDSPPDAGAQTGRGSQCTAAGSDRWETSHSLVIPWPQIPCTGSQWTLDGVL